MPQTRLLLVSLASIFCLAAGPASAQTLLPTPVTSDTEYTDTQEVNAVNSVITIDHGASLTIGAGAGYGLQVTAPSSDGSTPNLEFATSTTGHLVVTGRSDSGVYSSFTGAGEHSILDFSALTSVTFRGNSADDGGAIYSLGNSGDSTVSLGDYAAFSGNSADWSGGAIYSGSRNGASSVTVKGGSLFQDNLAGQSGGAIFIYGGSSSTLALDTALTGGGYGDIVFSGNKHQTTATAEANSIYLDSGTDITVQGDGHVYFNDPLAANASASRAGALSKTGAGFVQFMGANVLNAGAQAGQVNVNGGAFRLAGPGASFNAGSAAAFNVNSGGALAGTGTVNAGTISIIGRLSPDSYVYQAPADPRSPSAPVFIGNAYGNLIFDGTVTFGDASNNFATLDLDVADDNFNRDLITISGSVNYLGTGTHTVNLTSFVGGLANVDIMTASSGGIVQGNHGLTVGGLTLAGRMTSAVTLGGSAASLTLSTGNVSNVKNTWTGATNANWDFGTTNWNAAGNTFAANDYVIFDQTGHAQNTVTLNGATALVSGMQVGDATYTINYTFEDGAIIGRAGTANGLSLSTAEDGVLRVDSMYSPGVIFNNVFVDFDGGMVIGGSGYGSVTLTGGGAFADTMDITLHSVLHFDLASADYADGYAYFGTISGGGPLSKDGDGTLTLGGNNSGYSGDVYAYDGELRLTNAKAIGTGDIKIGEASTSGTLRLSFATDSVFSNYFFTTHPNSNQLIIDSASADVITTISNPGNYFEGATTVEKGILAVTGSLGPGAVNVNPNGALMAGTGSTIGELTMRSGSTLYLSDSGLGALNVNGNATFQSGLSRKADLASGYWQAGHSYAMLDVSGAVTGDSNITGQVGSNTVLGELAWGSGANANILYFNVLGTASLASYAQATPNQRAAAWGIGATNHNGALFSYFDHLPPNRLPEAYFQAAGAGHATVVPGLQIGAGALASNIIDQMGRFVDDEDRYLTVASLGGRLDQAASAGDRDGRSRKLWFGLSGRWQEVAGQAGQTAKATWKGPEATVGYDWRGENGWRLGGAFQFARQKYEEDGGRHEADLARLSLALYTGKAVDFGTSRLRLTGGAAYSHYQIDSTRRLTLPGLREENRADYGGQAWNLFAEAAWGWNPAERLGLEPFLGLSYTRLAVDDFTESGGLAALSGRYRDADTFNTTLGARAAFQATERLSLEAKLAWQHSFGDRTPESDFAFAGGEYFRIEGAPLARDAALIGLGLTATLNDRAAFTLGYDGALSHGSQSHSGTAVLAISW